MSLLACFIKGFTGAQAYWSQVGIEKKQCIYFANHTSHLDFLVLWSVLPKEARKNTFATGAMDYWASGPFRLWLSVQIFKVILIERENIHRSNNPITSLIRILDEGKSLIIFPEGGRNNCDYLKEFKSGIYYLAKARPNIDLVPVHINNANRALPKGECLPIPLICSIAFGNAIKLEKNENKKDFLKRAQMAVEECAL